MARHQRVLVTGADGFIGSHLVEALVRRGHAVRAPTQYNSFNTWGWLDRIDPAIAAEVEVIAGDIRDPAQVRALTRERDLVFHLAALIAIPCAYHAPDSYIETNVKGTLNVLQAARDLDVAKVVHTSTSEVYGTARFVPITESHPIQPQSPYAASKAAADHLAQAFYLSFGTPVATIRPFNAYGPRQSARAVIPTIITQALAGRRQIRLGALTPTRDFTFVEDTAEAFIAVALSDDAIGQVVNAGSDFEISIADLIRLIGVAMGEELEPALDEARMRPSASEVERLWADNAKIRALTGWRPAHGGREGFARGLSRTVEWFRRDGRGSGYKPDVYNI